MNSVRHNCIIDSAEIYPVERLMKEWKSPVYAFYEPVPRISSIGGRRCHEFHCVAHRCNYISRRFRDTLSKASTGNLILHVKSCWGEEAWNAARKCQNATDAREEVTKPLLKSGLVGIRKKRKVPHFHRVPTKAETRCVHRRSSFPCQLTITVTFRAEIVRWVAESLQPFEIVEDHGFQSLMRKGCPEYYIPPALTVSRDVKVVFTRTRDRIARMLQARTKDSLDTTVTVLINFIGLRR
jgi:hypothetical protein